MKLKAIFCVLILLAVWGCKKDEEVIPPERERSYLHLLGAAQRADSFDVTFDYLNADNIVITNYVYKRNWPFQGYADLQAAGIPDEYGNNKLYLRATKKNFQLTDTLAGPMDIILRPMEKSTLAFADSSGEMFMVKYEDIFASAAGIANVRFINLSQMAGKADLESTDGSISITGLNFLQDSPFSQYTAGNYSFVAKDDGGSVIATYSDVDLLEGSGYTFYISGNPGANLDYFKH